MNAQYLCARLRIRERDIELIDTTKQRRVDRLNAIGGEHTKHFGRAGAFLHPREQRGQNSLSCAAVATPPPPPPATLVHLINEQHTRGYRFNSLCCLPHLLFALADEAAKHCAHVQANTRNAKSIGDGLCQQRFARARQPH